MPPLMWPKGTGMNQMLILDVSDIQAMLHKLGLQNFNLQLIDQLEEDFLHWHTFNKSPRYATHFDHGVIELMPCSNQQLYSFKYVNGHPSNTSSGKLCVAAMGLLADVSTGYPLMISEMTLLTAVRTAAITALGARYLARNDSKVLAIIGCGAQSEFQAMAVMSLFNLSEVRIFDIDHAAMNKFSINLSGEFKKIIECHSVIEAIKDADIIITATAARKAVCLFNTQDVKAGTHIHAMGGDCPGKTELPGELLKQAKLVVEFTEQSLIEGEIQQLDASHIYAELWEIISKHKAGRENINEITIMDSVGFALEDFSTLKLVHKLAEELKLGKEIEFIPELDDPKNLYSLVR